MTTSRLVAAFRQTLEKFRKSNNGNVALIFAITLVPLLAATGMVVDYTRAAMVRSQMQDALDATALFLSKNTSVSTMSQTQLNTAAQSYFNVNFTTTFSGPVTLTPSYSSTGPSVTVGGTTNVATDFMGIVGVRNVPIGATSTAVWGHQRLRVALVLDNTTSMLDDGKIGALKTATASLLTQLKNAATNNGDVYVSIVPFVKDVNVGASNYAASWLQFDDNTDNSWDGAYGVCSKSTYTPRSSCISHGTCSISTKTTQSTCQSAGTCSISSKTSQSNCTSAYICSNTSYTTQTSCTSHHGTWNQGVWTAGAWAAYVWTPTSHSTWNGCVADRGASWTTGPGTVAGDDQQIYSTAYPSLFPVEKYSSCPQAMMGLSYNWTALNTLVTNMVANGSTNQPIGLVWGWQSLVGGGPLTAPALDPAYQYKQVIILLSDGLNTQDRWYPLTSPSNSNVDNRMYYKTSGGTISGTCKNVKDAGILVYSVQVDTGGDPTSTLLQNCASDSTMFFKLTSATQIITTFQAIGTALSDLRLSI